MLLATHPLQGLPRFYAQALVLLGDIAGGFSRAAVKAMNPANAKALVRVKTELGRREKDDAAFARALGAYRAAPDVDVRTAEEALRALAAALKALFGGEGGDDEGAMGGAGGPAGGDSEDEDIVIGRELSGWAGVAAAATQCLPACSRPPRA